MVMDIELDEMIESAKHFVNVAATPWDFNVRDKLIELKALRAQLETTQRELTAITISWENALAELDKTREQEPVGFIDANGDPILSIDGLKGGYLYRAPVPAMPIGFNQSLFAELNCIANSVEIADGESIDRQNALCHAANVIRSHANELLKDGPLVAQPAMPMQDDRIAKEWQEIWNPIDELVRPLTPLGHSVAVKAVELIKQALAMPIPKQEPAGAVPSSKFEELKKKVSCYSLDRISFDTNELMEILNSVDFTHPSPRITEQPAGAVPDLVCPSCGRGYGNVDSEVARLNTLLYVERNKTRITEQEPAGAVPDGWKLVPTRLNQAMLFAANGVKIKCGTDVDGDQMFTQLNSIEAINLFDAFLSSAPDAPESFQSLRITEQDAREVISYLHSVREFINNGVEFGFIRLPEFPDDPANDLLPKTDALLNKLNANAVAEVRQEHLRYTSDGALAECPCCGSLDVGGAHNNVHCYKCGLNVTAPVPLKNAIDIWNRRTGAVPAQAAAIPEDWQLVPKNVSGEMVGAAKNVGIRYGYDGMDQPLCTVLSPSELYKLWDALLSAAPKPNEKARD
jgi:hypothetical protein